MLTWTTGGAVPTPRTVQIRVQRSYPGRIRAGAPLPTRSMSPEEVDENIRHFTAGLRTPRSAPCTTLVLSGGGVASRADTPDALALARAEGVERVILHAGVEDLPVLRPARFSGLVDTLVIPLRPGRGDLATTGGLIAEAVRAGLDVATNTTLDAAALPLLSAAARVLRAAGPRWITFTYPFPINGGDSATLPPPPRAVAALRPALRILGDRAVTIKGLPACLLGEAAAFLRRTSNRWYVDADHQKEAALLFFPKVVSFYKEDVCRFCSADPTCDGFFAAYLRRPGFPPLSPLAAVSAPSP